MIAWKRKAAALLQEPFALIPAIHALNTDLLNDPPLLLPEHDLGKIKDHLSGLSKWAARYDYIKTECVVTGEIEAYVKEIGVLLR